MPKNKGKVRSNDELHPNSPVHKNELFLPIRYNNGGRGDCC